MYIYNLKKFCVIIYYRWIIPHKIKFLIICGIVALMRNVLQCKFRSMSTYECIAKEDILANLHEEVLANFTSNALNDCDYQYVVDDETTLSINKALEGDLFEGHRIREGGEYAPQECKPKFSTAIIVPYRDRPEQLRNFLVYMHTFFRRQKIHYRIYVIEQVDLKLFNRAKLMNVGAVVAMAAGYPCLVLHDVDLLPLKPANIYACTKQPRHMTASIDKHRFLLPYFCIFGGATAIVSKQFVAVNGMSNKFFGWGAEDDDFLERIGEYNLKWCRFDSTTSRYYMLRHNRVKVKGDVPLLPITKTDIAAEGLNTLKYTLIETVIHPLFTHIVVEL